MTASETNGKEIFRTSKIYMPQATDSRSNHMVLGPDKKLGLIRDTSIQPFTPKEETTEIPLPEGVTDVDLEINLTYQPRPGNVYPIHNIKKRVSLDHR
ncbi:MAG: hypothetical protein M1511_07625 [Deltaproteobacteria bacterium]|nr:hypothetical protein [Deltaproteobacteria bacterium]